MSTYAEKKAVGTGAEIRLSECFCRTPQQAELPQSKKAQFQYYFILVFCHRVHTGRQIHKNLGSDFVIMTDLRLRFCVQMRLQVVK